MTGAVRQATFAELIRRGALAIGDGYRAKLDELGGTGPIFLRAARLTASGFDWSDPERFRDELGGQIAPKLGRPGDAVITTKGNSVGRCGYVPEGAPVFVYSPHLSYWRSLDTETLAPGFLRYWALGPEFGRQLAALAHGTDMAPYLSLADQRRLVVTIPEPERQRGIAATLGALDDKIESNRRLAVHAATLIEALADELLSTRPVRNARLADVVDFNRSQVRPGADSARLLYIDIASVSPGRIDAVQDLIWREAPSRARRAVSDGDVLYSTVRPGRRSFALLVAPAPQTVASTGFAVMTPRPAIGSSLLTVVVGSPQFATYLESVAHGSAYPAVSVDAMGMYELVLPVEVADVERFEAATMPLRRRAHQAEQENERLAALRDVLLPELLSGRLRVPEAAEAVADATA